jgi:hypothetical protein
MCIPNRSSSIFSSQVSYFSLSILGSAVCTAWHVLGELHMTTSLRAAHCWWVSNKTLPSRATAKSAKFSPYPAVCTAQCVLDDYLSATHFIPPSQIGIHPICLIISQITSPSQCHLSGDYFWSPFLHSHHSHPANVTCQVILSDLQLSLHSHRHLTQPMSSHPSGGSFWSSAIRGIFATNTTTLRCCNISTL